MFTLAAGLIELADQQFDEIAALKESLENAAPRPVSPFYSVIFSAGQKSVAITPGGHCEICPVPETQRLLIQSR